MYNVIARTILKNSLKTPLSLVVIFVEADGVIACLLHNLPSPNTNFDLSSLCVRAVSHLVLQRVVSRERTVNNAMTCTLRIGVECRAYVASYVEATKTGCQRRQWLYWILELFLWSGYLNWKWLSWLKRRFGNTKSGLSVIVLQREIKIIRRFSLNLIAFISTYRMCQRHAVDGESSPVRQNTTELISNGRVRTQ